MKNATMKDLWNVTFDTNSVIFEITDPGEERTLTNNDPEYYEIIDRHPENWEIVNISADIIDGYPVVVLELNHLYR